MTIKKGKKQEADKSLLYAKLRPGSNFSGKVPNLLIGTYGYPDVHVGSMVGEQRSAKELVKQKLTVQEIVEERQTVVNTRTQGHIKQQFRYKEEAQDIAKSKKAVETEIEIEKPLRLDTQFHERAMPHGPSAQLKSMEITENPTIPRSVERITSDTDAKATTAMHELQKKGIDEYHMTKLLSAGTLGQEESRKLVPTKWSITAVDDTFGKKLQEEIADYDDHSYTFFTGNYLGNYFFIIIQPGDFSFELVEIVLPHGIYNQGDELLITKDHEFQQGRKKYVEQTAGGYYASKLPTLEYFRKVKRQGRVTEFRVITPEYTTPLGVWVVREGVRLTLSTNSANQPSGTSDSSRREFTREEFSSLGEIKNELLKLLKQFYHKPEDILKESILFKTEQKGLRSFFT
ncbi:MAG: hypothetical protein KC535_02060 [Nanoarchaeota archaeon]|nr:hypothetical protein [Nanoarchaeota archaeon]